VFGGLSRVVIGHSWAVIHTPTGAVLGQGITTRLELVSARLKQQS
jgi:hypothetical protein